MFSFFRQSFKQWARSGTRAAGARPAPCTRRLECEMLEDRVLPSITTPEILVNTNKAGQQHQAASATSSNGSSVVVWTEVKSSVDSDIKAQRFNSGGAKVGGEILVAGGRSPQQKPVVAMDSKGNFAVAWLHVFSSSDTDVHAAVFTSGGSRIGSEINVADTPKREFDPAIAMAANGDFTVAYTYQFSSSDTDIKAAQYTLSGGVVRRFDVAATTRKEESAAIDMAADGKFAVAYVRADDVILNRYAKNAALWGTHVVAASTRSEREPDVAIDNAGYVVVAWQEYTGSSWNVLGRKYLNNGTAGGVFTVATTSAQESLPSVAVNRDNGNFIVAYKTQMGSGAPTVKVAEFAASTAMYGTLTIGSSLADPHASHGNGRYLVAAQSQGSKGGDWDGGVFARFGIL